MKGLLLVAHGSRREQSNDEIADVAKALQSRVSDKYEHTVHAFLELAKPSIPEGIEMLINQGASEITVLPYFLSAGRHVHQDVPEIVQAKQGLHPEIPITIAPYIGEASEMIDVLAAISKQVE